MYKRQAKTPTVVFCFSFTAKGLEVSQKKGIVEIEKEGSISKFVDRVKSISFSARRAIANGQKVLYVTERCVFRLTPKEMCIRDRESLSDFCVLHRGKQLWLLQM